MFIRIAFLILVLFILGIGGVFVGTAQMVDTDNDGIYDDGAGSGTVGDNPCTGGNTLSCDDNCVNAYNPEQADSDGDGIGNACEDNAINFSNAAGSLVRIPNNNLPSIADKGFTVEAWVKSKTSNLNGGIFSYYDNANGTVMWVKNNEPKFRIVDVEGFETGIHPSSTLAVASGGSMVRDTRYHIAGILINSAHSHPESESCSAAVMAETPHLDIHVNGEFKNCASTGGQFADDPSEDLLIGGFQMGMINYFRWETNLDGIIDEVRFWTVARTQQEIQQCMNYELGFVLQCQVDSSILKGYWRFDEGTGAVVADSSGNGYSGEILLSSSIDNRNKNLFNEKV